MEKGFIEMVDFPISTGKEANVFRATTPAGEYVALKVYKKETTHFHKKLEYIVGDPRFEKIKKRTWEIVKAFAKKEFKNLEICERHNVNAPQPYFVRENVVLMEFLGEDGLPYPKLAESAVTKKDLDNILEDIFKMLEGNLIHSDLSEFNILKGKEPYLIDFGQGVVIQHPHAKRFLKRDIWNIMNFFSKRGIKRDFESVWDEAEEYFRC